MVFRSAWRGRMPGGLAGACLSLLLAAGSVSAQAPAGGIGEVTPFVGFRLGGELERTDGEGEVELEGAVSAGLLLDIYARSNGSYQLLYSRQRTDAALDPPGTDTASREITLHAIQLGGTYRSDWEVFQPYLAATIGASHLRTSGEGGQSETFFSASLGGGVNVRPAKRVGVRLEGRFYGTLVDADTDLFCDTGPTENVCAVRVEGSLLLQFETFLGVTVRF